MELRSLLKKNEFSVLIMANPDEGDASSSSSRRQPDDDVDESLKKLPDTLAGT